MRYLACLTVCVGMLAIGSIARAQEFAVRDLQAASGTGYADLPPTASMSAETWVYLQEYHKQNDPQALIFRRAQQKAENRRRRLESLAWYGYSNLRPTVNPMPMTTSSYSPAWGGNASDPFRWLPTGSAYLLILRR